MPALASTPLISIFTPCHKPVYLAEAWDSIRQQNYSNFEWVIVPNNGCTAADIDRVLYSDDPRIRVVPYVPTVYDEPASMKIGALKRFACDRCRGDLFLELDYDDILVPDTLPRIAQAYHAGAGFIYSDAAAFKPDLSSSTFSLDHGWEHYPVTVYGKTFTVSRTFPITPRSLCEVYYAPDHLRCWTRKTYYKVGGHDRGLNVCDDHDLICRTYLAGARFWYIGCCGYLYRMHDDNTVTNRQDEITRQSAINRDRYLLPLIVEWCRRENSPALELTADWRHMQSKAGRHGRTPFTPVKHISARSVLQYIPAAEQIAFFNAAWENLEPGGFLTIEVPSESGRFASMNPLHVTRFNLNSFLYYTEKEFNQYLPGSHARFQLVSCHEFYPNEMFASLDMKVIRAVLMALGDTRLPGLKKI